MSSISLKSRPNDYFYDSAFVVSGSKDYYRHAALAKQAMIKFAVCPIFPSMFSDLQNYPSKRYVIRRPSAIPVYAEKRPQVESSSRNQVMGQDRYKYFHNATSSQTQTSLPHLDESCFYKVDMQKVTKVGKTQSSCKLIRNEKVQTMYRDAEVLTSPWEPDIKAIHGDAELLKLDFLKWGNGLPAGWHEAELINRNRKRRKMESFAKAAKNLADQRDIIAEMERIAWADRERDIDEMQDLRMKLLENMLNEIHTNSKCRNEKKLRLLFDVKMKEKEDKIAKVLKHAEREKRRLRFNFQKTKKLDVFQEYADYKSELYCPLLRNGINPKYGHEKLSTCLNKYIPQFSNLENFDILPSGLTQRSQIDDKTIPGSRLCQKETKWTLPLLKSIYAHLTELREQEVVRPHLRICTDTLVTPPLTPEVEETDRPDDNIHKSASFLQKLLRGRATQNVILSGRHKCHELIDELRCTYPLLKEEKIKLARAQQQRNNARLIANKCESNVKILEGSLKKLSGRVVGTLLDFLNKDLNRLKRERKLHAAILLIERMRQIREAEEAGRRQKELRRRMEHDEMFKQIIKVQQDSVDLYLQDIISEGMQFSSEDQAKEYVTNLADKIMQEQDALEIVGSQMEREEYIAEMVHAFIVPEVEKEIVRQRRHEKQNILLKNAHEEIYNRIENLPKPPSEKSSLSSSSCETVTWPGSPDVTSTQEGNEQERKSVSGEIGTPQDFILNPPKALRQQSIESVVHFLVDHETEHHAEVEDGSVESSSLLENVKNN